MTIQLEQLEHKFIKTNGVNLHVVQTGPEDGPLLILLHGFPDFWYGWRKQIDPLASAGYRLWIPDQRGYNLSDKPQGFMRYSRDELAKDVIGLIDAAGREKAVVIGHDWGAAVAWWAANLYPDRIEKAIILNVPHHQIILDYLRTNPAQLRKSWYIFYFQILWLPEISAKLNNWKAMVDSVQRSAHPGTFTEGDFNEYRKAWSKPGAITAMINYYRAAPWARLPKDQRIKVPTLIIWGRQDPLLVDTLAQDSLAMCDDGRLIYIDEATHWVHHEEAGRVNQLIIEFLTQGN